MKDGRIRFHNPKHWHTVDKKAVQAAQDELKRVI